VSRAVRPALIAALLALAVAACERRPPEEPPEPEPRLELTAVAFEDLEGWADDDLDGVLAAFLRSCDRLLPQPDDRAMGGSPLAGTIGDWRLPCTAARDLAPVADGDLTRAFLEDWFQPYAAANHDRREGLFTGYYEPLLQGAQEPGERFSVPLYERPDDLVGVDLGEFDAELAGRRLVGRLVDGRLRPFPSRAEIESGAL
jgi:membrane-bound lytic murein transglycosylase A